MATPAAAEVDEQSPLAPGTDRARRRVAAESVVTAWCAARGVRCVILRTPGIYGPHRLPLGTPATRRSQPCAPKMPGPGNRIHVDDLVSVHRGGR